MGAVPDVGERCGRSLRTCLVEHIAPETHQKRRHLSPRQLQLRAVRTVTPARRKFPTPSYTGCTQPRNHQTRRPRTARRNPHRTRDEGPDDWVTGPSANAGDTTVDDTATRQAIRIRTYIDPSLHEIDPSHQNLTPTPPPRQIEFEIARNSGRSRPLVNRRTPNLGQIASTPDLRRRGGCEAEDRDDSHSFGPTPRPRRTYLRRRRPGPPHGLRYRFKQEVVGAERETGRSG